MPFLLILFLAISFVVIIAGLMLSVRKRVDRTAYYAEPARYSVAVPIRASTAYQAVEPIRSRRYRLEVERQGGAGSWVSTLLGGIYRRRDGSANCTTTVFTLVAIFLLSLYLLNDLLPSHPLIGLVPFYGNTTSTSSTSSSQKVPEIYSASAALVRLSQLDPAQYDTAAQFNTWAMSACSAASMTEVINAYGHHYRISDILKVEAQLGEITPALGLTESIGIQRTLAQFGFQTTWGNDLSLHQVINIANHGRPEIVDFPPSKYAGGHLLVVIGGNANYVYLADSSSFDRHSLTRAQFLDWWGGFSAIATPQ